MMNKQQINKTRSYSVIILVLENYSTLFSNYPELTQGQQRLKTLSDQIELFRQVQETNNAGLTKNKIKHRLKLSKLYRQFSTALLAYATSTQNIELKTKATYSNSSLLRAADPIFYDIGRLLLNLATPLAPELVRFFITQAELDDMETTLTEFKASIPRKRLATGSSKVSTGNINDIFKIIDTLLKDEIDVLLKPFEFTQPDFYNEYLSARSIVETGGNRKAKTAEPVV